MTHVFISHASENKPRVRPLVEALALLGLPLWIDRPGRGESHFNFDQDFIDRFGIRGLRTGQDWDEQLRRAIAEAAVVVACLSRSFSTQRLVLSQEVMLAVHHNKLVACIVDDLPFSDLPNDLGLKSVARLQAERVDPSRLEDAVALMRQPGTTPEMLTPDARQQWEIVRNLVAEIRTLAPVGALAASEDQLHLAREALSQVPIGPMVLADQIPEEVVLAFAELYGEPEQARRMLAAAMRLRADCNSEAFSERQILVSNNEVLPASAARPNDYWWDVLIKSGFKSRRTLAAFLVEPSARSALNVHPDRAALTTEFLNWLTEPT